MTRPLTVLLSATAVSLLGNVLTSVTVPWFVLVTTGSAVRTGVAAFASAVPIGISAAFAGSTRMPMERATAAYDAVYRGAKMIGAPLAGLLIVWLGPALILYLNGATFLLSAALIRVGLPEMAHTGGDHGRYLAHLREGLAFLWQDRLLRSIVAMVLITNTLDMGAWPRYCCRCTPGTSRTTRASSACWWGSSERARSRGRSCTARWARGCPAG
jgi:hypothetical protein